MSELIDGKFSCVSCGKSFTWRPEIAGKRAKCKCGQVLNVPSWPVADEPEILYDVAPSEPQPAPQPTPKPVPRIQPVAYRSAPSEADRIRQQRASRSLISRGRDIYAPLVILASGVVLILGWAIFAIDASPITIVVASIFTFVATAVKLVVLIGLALVVAPHMGISFGTFWTAVLKFAAIIVITDSALLWLDEIMPEHMPRRFTIELLLSAATISLLSHLLFDMDREETAKFAVPFAVISWVLGLVVTFGLSAMLAAMLSPSSVTPAVAATGPSVATSSTPGPKPDSPRDQSIRNVIRKGGMSVLEGRDWTQRFGPDRTHLVQRFYEAGAQRVYVEMRMSKQFNSSKAYVELPDKAESRGSTFALYHEYCRENAIPPDPASSEDTGQHFLVIDLASSKNQ